MCCIAKAKDGNDVVVYDGAANVSIFYNEKLVTDVWNVITSAYRALISILFSSSHNKELFWVPKFVFRLIPPQTFCVD